VHLPPCCADQATDRWGRGGFGGSTRLRVRRPALILVVTPRCGRRRAGRYVAGSCPGCGSGYRLTGPRWGLVAAKLRAVASSRNRWASPTASSTPTNTLFSVEPFRTLSARRSFLRDHRRARDRNGFTCGFHFVSTDPRKYSSRPAAGSVIIHTWPRSKMTSIRRVPAATPNGPPKPILSAASWYENSPAHSAWAVAIDEQRPRQSVLEPV